MKEFNDEFHILRFDCRGQGKSPWPDGIYSLSSHVEDLDGLISKLNLEKFSILGLSNGGRIALEYARKYPKNVAKVIACDTYAKPSNLLKLKLNSWLSAFESGGATHRFDVSTPWIWGETVLKEKPELIEFYRGKAGTMKPHVVNAHILGAMEEEIEVSEIECPIQFIVGKEDVLTPPFYHEDMLENSKHNKSKLSIVPGGHASILEYPETIRKEVLPFLRESL